MVTTISCGELMRKKRELIITMEQYGGLQKNTYTKEQYEQHQRELDHIEQEINSLKDEIRRKEQQKFEEEAKVEQSYSYVETAKETYKRANAKYAQLIKDYRYHVQQVDEKREEKKQLREDLNWLKEMKKDDGSKLDEEGLLKLQQIQELVQ